MSSLRTNLRVFMSFYVASKTLSAYYATEDGLVASPELGGLPSEGEVEYNLDTTIIQNASKKKAKC